MRSVPRRERHRRLRNAKDCACRYHSPTPQIFDRLELLDQQLNYALPVGIISQAIITTDNYLRIPLYSITDWHRSPISDSHPFDQPGT